MIVVGNGSANRLDRRMGRRCVLMPALRLVQIEKSKRGA